LARLDLLALGSLEFRPIEGPWRTAIELGLRAIRAGGDAGAVFNAANEAAVRAFLDRRIPFGRILEVVESVCGSHEASPVRAVDDVLDADREARSRAEALIRAGGGSRR
jgi:1-deoxy-D-xylulose-5-phosphate reductoisomerase